MRYLTFIFLLFCISASAAVPEKEVPVISFSQQVDIVVSAKRDVRLYELKISQENEDIILHAIADKNLDREEAKILASSLIMMTKVKSLDDRPKKKDVPGKGLYNYRVEISRPDGVLLVTALKPHNQESVTFEDPFLTEPLTRVGASGR